jgi:predicted N-acyltransferase
MIFIRLERSGSVRTRTGWQPMHLVAEDRSTIVGAVPAMPSRTPGQYVFDYTAAEAYERAGGTLPKLLWRYLHTGAGAALLVRPGEHADADGMRSDLLADICNAERRRCMSPS